MKTQIILFFTGILLVTSCSLIRNDQSYKQNQYDAINDFLETKIKEDTEEIFVIKEKANIDETIKIFNGGYPEYPDTHSIQTPLFNKKNWLKMKNKYEGKKRNTLNNDSYWNENDFRNKKIEFVNGIEFWKKLKSDYLYGEIDRKQQQIKKVFAFSTPIIYKRKYLTFLVFEGDNDFNPWSYSEKYIVVMKKINRKWVVIQKAWSKPYS